MKRVAIIYPFYQVGGYEKWASAVSKSLDGKYEIEALIRAKSDTKFGHYNETMNAKFFESPLSMIFYLLRTKPDITISGFTKWNVLFSLVAMLIRSYHISSVHLTIHSKSNIFYYTYQHVCAKIYCALSNVVICVSDGIVGELSQISPKSTNKLQLIYNPCIHQNEITFRSPAALREKFRAHENIRIICVGRLHYQKGFDILLEALSRSSILEMVEVSIFGEGEEEKNLLELKEKLQLKNVIFRGISSKIISEYRNHDIFVLSSRYEGFGNVLAEALAQGCYCISFNVPHGPSEILSGGKLGTLVQSARVDQLALAIDQLGESLADFTAAELEEHCRLFTFETFSSRVTEILKDEEDDLNS